MALSPVTPPMRSIVRAKPKAADERRPEVVTGVDDEVREIAGFTAHGRARLVDADEAP